MILESTVLDKIINSCKMDDDQIKFLMFLNNHLGTCHSVSKASNLLLSVLILLIYVFIMLNKMINNKYNTRDIMRKKIKL